MKAYSMDRFWTIVGVEGGRVTGMFVAVIPNSVRDPRVTVYPLDVKVWHDDDHTSGRVLYGKDFTAWVLDDDVELPRHMIASNKRADIEGAWEPMLAALRAVALVAFDLSKEEA